MAPSKSSKSVTARRTTRSRGRPTLKDVSVIDQTLLETALNEFFKHGYGGTSMTQIVKAAGVSKTTLYARYSDKAELFRAIVHQQIDRASGLNLLRSHVSSLSLEQGLIAYANRMLEISMKGDLLAVNRLIFSESHRFPELGIAAAEKAELGIRQISNFLRECAIRDGVPCSNPDSVASVFIYMLQGWYINVMLSSPDISAEAREEWVEQAIKALLAGRENW